MSTGSEDIPHEHEQEFRDDFATLPERDIAEWATSTLAVVIQEAAGLDGKPAEATTRKQQRAMLVLAVRMYRAARAGMSMLAVGYELEAGAMTRIGIELLARMAPILKDTTGEEASAWLRGERTQKTAAAIRDAMDDDDLWKTLSRAAHGDPRAVYDHLGASEPGSDALVFTWGPCRTDRTPNGLLIYSLLALVVTGSLARITGQIVPREEELGETLAQAFERLGAPAAFIHWPREASSQPDK